jgi:hypothetical protein
MSPGGDQDLEDVSRLHASEVTGSEVPLRPMDRELAEGLDPNLGTGHVAPSPIASRFHHGTVPARPPASRAVDPASAGAG